MTLSAPDRWLLPLLGGLALALAAVSLTIGAAGLPPSRALAALIVDDGAVSIVMREIRLPRAILSVSIGAALGLSGAALQGYLRNPLADAGLMGIGPGAALGAVAAIYGGVSALFPLALPLMALAGGFVAMALVLAMAGRGDGPAGLILAGVAVSSLAGALTALALSLSENPFAALEIVYWMLGSLNDRSMQHVWLALPFMAGGGLLLVLAGRGLDALSLGAETARSLGVNMTALRLLILAGTAATVGAATAIAGAIGFVGLVVPHLLRPWVGARPSRLLVASALGGAALLTAADIAARLVAPDRDLKLGVVTALIGTPFFLRLIAAGRSGSR